MFGVISTARKGGVPNVKLRGINEADFFQKNYQVGGKGWSLNHEGTLVEYKTPLLTKDIEEKVIYEVSNEALIRQALYGK